MFAAERLQTFQESIFGQNDPHIPGDGLNYDAGDLEGCCSKRDWTAGRSL